MQTCLIAMIGELIFFLYRQIEKQREKMVITSNVNHADLVDMVSTINYLCWFQCLFIFNPSRLNTIANSIYILFLFLTGKFFFKPRPKGCTYK
jgi:hypothetical protein